MESRGSAHIYLYFISGNRRTLAQGNVRSVKVNLTLTNCSFLLEAAGTRSSPSAGGDF